MKVPAAPPGTVLHTKASKNESTASSRATGRYRRRIPDWTQGRR